MDGPPTRRRRGKNVPSDLVRLIRRRRAAGWRIGELAEQYGYARQTISKIVHGRTHNGVVLETTLDPLRTNFKPRPRAADETKRRRPPARPTPAAADPEVYLHHYAPKPPVDDRVTAECGEVLVVSTGGAYFTTATVFIETYRLDVRCCIPCSEAVHRASRAYKP